MLSKNLSAIAWRLAFLSSFCCLLQISRMYWSESLGYIFLPANLLLAWVPLLMARAFLRQSSRWKSLALLGGWLIFFPNSAYIITDLIHLKPRPDIPLLFDSMMLFTFALTGFVTGMLSALLVYQKLRTHLSAFKSKSLMVAAMFLSGYGVYLGRYLRWNSWDILFHPLPILSDTFIRILNPAEHPLTYVISILTGLLLTLSFLSLESLFPFSETNSSLSQ